MHFISADQIFDGFRYLQAGTVLVLSPQNMLMDVLNPGQIEKNRIQHFEGVLTPGFVNAHCHLELSHLKGQISRNTGLIAFAKELISKRGKMHAEERAEWMTEADREMQSNGIVAVGDISNTNESLRCKMESPIRYHTFVELIGLNPANATPIFEKGKELLQIFRQEGLPASLAPHAPYSVSLPLADFISDLDEKDKAPLCIHNQESMEEAYFFMDKTGNINDLYAFLGLDLSFFTAPGKNSLEAFHPHLKNRPRTFVHNTFSQKSDIELAAGEGTYWCFCPLANLYIENAHPNYDLFPADAICFGTDSLASNTVLDLSAEVRAMGMSRWFFPDEVLLRGLTSNGAKALGLQEEIGQLRINKNAGLNQIKINKKEFRFISKIA